VRSNEDTIAKSLESDYRPGHLFALRQSPADFRYSQSLVMEVDHEIKRGVQPLATAPAAQAALPTRTKTWPYQRSRYEPKNFDLRTELYRVFGVDLTTAPGISATTAQTILCEIGTDVSRLRNASAFASWLGLCPENKISGGKVLYTKSELAAIRRALATSLFTRRGVLPLVWRSAGILCLNCDPDLRWLCESNHKTKRSSTPLWLAVFS
jgi:hypothetical protein